MNSQRALAVVVGVVVACSVPSLRAAAQPPSARDTTELAQLLESLRDTSVAARQATTAVLRARALEFMPVLQDWSRNESSRFKYLAANALVQIGLPAYPFIRQSLQDEGLRFTFSNALHAADSAQTLLRLLEPMLTDPDPAVRAAGVDGLDPYREDAAELTGAIIRALEDTHGDVRAAALALHLSQINSDSAQRALADRLVRFLYSAEQGERSASLYSLGNMHPHGRRALPQILLMAEHDPYVRIRWLAARVLTWQGAEPKDALPVLMRMMQDPANTVRFEALMAIGGIGVAGLDAAHADSIVRTVDSYLVAPSESMRDAAISTLAAIGAPAAERLIAALKSPHESVAMTAAAGLAALPQLAVIDEPLLEALSDARDSVRTTAALALVGAGARVEDRLADLARRSPTRRSVAAAEALRLIELTRMLDVVDRCYDIEYDAWTPPIPYRTIEGLLPPKSVRFRAMIAHRPSGRRPAAFQVEQRWRDGWVRAGYWRPDSASREILLDAEPSLSGVQFRLREGSDETLVGEARTYWDFRRESEVATVRFKRITC